MNYFKLKGLLLITVNEPQVNFFEDTEHIRLSGYLEGEGNGVLKQ